MRFVLLLIAAVVAVAAGVAALQYAGKDKPAQTAAGQPAPAAQNVNTVDVLVAREPIAVGTTLDETMIDRQPWPSHLVLEGFVTADSKDANLTGRVARAPFAAREPFMQSKLANPNDPSFLAAALPENMRAITLATDAVSGVAGYVFPGDRVDVLLTHNIPEQMMFEQGAAKGNRRIDKPEVAEVLASNVRVLAVNVRAPGGAQETPKSLTPSSVTVEVDEKVVQKIRLAEKNGTLSLALRSIKDQEQREAPDPTMLPRLTRAGMSEETDSIRIIRGPGKDFDTSIPLVVEGDAAGSESNGEADASAPANP